MRACCPTPPHGRDKSGPYETGNELPADTINRVSPFSANESPFKGYSCTKTINTIKYVQEALHVIAIGNLLPVM